jgi:hypothetical protein
MFISAYYKYSYLHEYRMFLCVKCCVFTVFRFLENTYAENMFGNPAFLDDELGKKFSFYF